MILDDRAGGGEGEGWRVLFIPRKKERKFKFMGYLFWFYRSPPKNKGPFPPIKSMGTSPKNTCVYIAML